MGGGAEADDQSDDDGDVREEEGLAVAENGGSGVN